MKKKNLVFVIPIIVLVIALIVMVLLYLNAIKMSKNNLENTLQSANEVFELNKKISELEEELEQYKTSFTVEIINIDGTETKTLKNASKLKEKLENLEYNNEICQGITDYILKCYDGTVYYIKSECKGIQKEGKEAVVSDEEMEEIKNLILNANTNGELANEEVEIYLNTTTNTTINSINSTNVINTTNHTIVSGSGNNQITSIEPYIPDGMDVAVLNDNSGIKASDIELNRDSEKVKIEILKDTITNKSVEILITDNNEPDYGWGESYRLQIKENNSWKDLEPISELSFKSIGYNLNKDNQLKQKINWERLYGKLKNGTYRIVKQVYDNGNVDLYSDEFEIK